MSCLTDVSARTAMSLLDSGAESRGSRDHKRTAVSGRARNGDVARANGTSSRDPRIQHPAGKTTIYAQFMPAPARTSRPRPKKRRRRWQRQYRWIPRLTSVVECHFLASSPSRGRRSPNDVLRVYYTRCALVQRPLRPRGCRFDGGGWPRASERRFFPGCLNLRANKPPPLPPPPAPPLPMGDLLNVVRRIAA